MEIWSATPCSPVAPRTAPAIRRPTRTGSKKDRHARSPVRALPRRVTAGGVDTCQNHGYHAFVNLAEDLDLLFESLEDRALGPGRPAQFGALELAKVVESLDHALQSLKLIERRSRASEWHSDIQKRVPPEIARKFHSNSFRDMDIAYGKRNKAGHDSYDWAATQQDVRARIRLVRTEARELIAALPMVCDALFDLQVSDAHQRLAVELAAVVERACMGGKHDAAERVCAIGAGIVGPSRAESLQVTEVDPRRRMKRILRYAAAKQASSCGHQLIQLGRDLLGEAADLGLDGGELQRWVDCAQVELGGRGGALNQNESDALHVVRVAVESVESGLLRVRHVALIKPRCPLPERVRGSVLSNVRAARAENLGDLVWEVLKALNSAMGARSLRWSRYVLQIEVPADAAYLDTPQLDQRFRAVAVRPLIGQRSAVSLSVPAISRPGCGPTSLATESLMSPSDLCHLLSDRGALCLFAAPLLVDPRCPRDQPGRLCGAVAAFLEHPLAVHFHLQGVDAQVAAIFGDDDQLPLDKLLSAAQAMRRQRAGLTVLWDDPAYDEHDPEALA